MSFGTFLPRPKKRLPRIPTRLRQIVVILVFGSLCIWAIGFSPQMTTWRQQWQGRLHGSSQPFSFLPSSRPTINGSSQEIEDKAQLIELHNSEILHAIQTQRLEGGLRPLTEDTTLNKLARLIALEAEENASLAVPQNMAELLQALIPTPPKNAEVIILFAPSIGTAPNIPEQLASSSALLNSQTTLLGIATRSATLEKTNGTLAAIVLSSSFSTRAPQPRTEGGAPTRPTFTGQDLWQAVQNYRRAHSLFSFEQSNELCTVASIRVNELLELGKLDNHDGFSRRSEEFFERNPGWSAINENIAAGYQTAVQTVEWGWDQSLGHQALIQSQEYPKACAAANSGFAVLITGK